MHNDQLSSQNPPDKTVRWARRLILFASLFYLTAVFSLLILFRFVGERWWPVSVLLYLPMQTWLLPLAIFFPLAALFQRRLLIIFVLCLLPFVLWFAGLRFRLRKQTPAVGAPCLTLLTNNIAQSNRQSMSGFVRAEAPDILVFEEATGRAAAFRRAYPGRWVAAAGEFVVVSRYRVESGRFVSAPPWRNPPAASFRIAWPEGPFTLFVVHVPTPRPDFLHLRGRGLLWELVRSPGSLGQRIADYRESMRMRVVVARALAEAMAAEPGPVLAAGDFNMPAWGFIHSLFASRLTDAFEAAGSGFGFTFPGETRNPVAGFGPWLRIDTIFCNRNWKVLSCDAEPWRRSKHRCVAARFELVR